MEGRILVTLTSKHVCIRCGHEGDILSERKFRCPKCGNLLKIVSEFPTLSREDWMARIGLRLSGMSGVWRYPWIMPDVPTDKIVSIGEGLTPLLPAGDYLKEYIGGDLDLWLSLRGYNPTGSFKDDGMTVLVTIAYIGGVPFVICASTGDTSASLAAFCARAGIPCVVLLPAGKITDEQIMQVRLYGAKVILVPGDFDDCMRVLRDLVERYGAYPGNSLNPARIEGHQAPVFQMWEQFGGVMPEVVALPLGNGSHTSGSGKGLETLQYLGFQNRTRILSCQAKAANPLATGWAKIHLKDSMNSEEEADALAEWLAIHTKVVAGETLASAIRIGDPVSAEKVMRVIIKTHGAIVDATEQDIVEAMIANDKDGIFLADPQSAVMLAGLRKARRFGWLKKDQKVVAVCTANGLKFGHAMTGLGTEPILASDCQTDTIARIVKI